MKHGSIQQLQLLTAKPLMLSMRRVDTLLLLVTKIIDLGWAGGGYCFYAWYAIIGHTTPLKVLWCRESLLSSKAFRSSASQWSVLSRLLCASPIVLPLGCALELVLGWNLRLDSTAHTA